MGAFHYRNSVNEVKQDNQTTTPVRSNRSSSSNSSSSDSSDYEKGLPYKNEEESADSGTSFTFHKIPNPSLNTLPNNTRVLPKNIQSVSRNVSMVTYASTVRDSDISSVTKQRIPTPDISLYDTDTSDISDDEKKNLTRKSMATIYCCIYGLLLTVTGSIIYLNYQSYQTSHVSEVFTICISITGMMWLAFFHIDLYLYKRSIIKRMMGTAEQIDTISTSTDFNYVASVLGTETPSYRFLTGRHSGSFYLKIGLAAFCFGHLINEGLLLGQQALDYIQEDRYELGCGNVSSVIVHIVKPLYSFYQLFIVFKYSNIVINRHKTLACFAIMHIMATCLCFWFGTIVEDALEDYHHKLGRKQNSTSSESFNFTTEHPLCVDLTSSQCECVSDAVLSINNFQAIPYLFPFTIEFNILLAGVWFIVWHNIGKEHHRANPHHFHHKIHNNDGTEEVTFQSNLVISADCHASNKGLFAGLLLLLVSIISIIVFFVAMSSKDSQYKSIGISIHYVQEGALTVLTLACVLIAHKQLSKLDFNKHPITFLDDVLLFAPLPFYFVQATLTIISEYQKKSIIRIVMSILVPVQVILQTPFIIDGLRRCSNSRSLKYKKPGREIVTFLIVCNLTMWIINTFEAKSVEYHYGLNTYFGEFMWMLVSHTTLPLMLFYRFHSSVCLADIWKSAYQKGE